MTSQGIPVGILRGNVPLRNPSAAGKRRSGHAGATLA